MIYVTIYQRVVNPSGSWFLWYSLGLEIAAGGSPYFRWSVFIGKTTGCTPRLTELVVKWIKTPLSQCFGHLEPSKKMNYCICFPSIFRLDSRFPDFLNFPQSQLHLLDHTCRSCQSQRRISEDLYFLRPARIWAPAQDPLFGWSKELIRAGGAPRSSIIIFAMTYKRWIERGGTTQLSPIGSSVLCLPQEPLHQQPSSLLMNMDPNVYAICIHGISLVEMH